MLYIDVGITCVGFRMALLPLIDVWIERCRVETPPESDEKTSRGKMKEVNEDVEGASKGTLSESEEGVTRQDG